MPPKPDSGLPDSTSADALQTDALHENQTPQGPDFQSMLAQYQRDLDANRAELQTARGEIESLKRQQQSTKDTITATLRKSIRRDFEAIDRLAAREGWTAEDVRKRKESAAQDALMSIGEAEQAEEQPKPETHGTVDAPRFEPVQAATPKPRNVQEQKVMLEQWLGAQGLKPDDLGEQGINPFLGMTDNDPRVQQFTQIVERAKAARTRQAGKSAAELVREGEAEEVADELEKYGSLGTLTPGSPGQATKFDPYGDVDGTLERGLAGMLKPRR